MTVYIEPLGAAILFVGIVVGYIVYKHTRTSTAPASRGDVVGAIGTAAVVITTLVLLLGGGNKTTTEGENPARETSTSTTR